jgi:hypothetical protein
VESITSTWGVGGDLDGLYMPGRRVIADHGDVGVPGVQGRQGAVPVGGDDLNPSALGADAADRIGDDPEERAPTRRYGHRRCALLHFPQELVHASARVGGERGQPLPGGGEHQPPTVTLIQLHTEANAELADLHVQGWLADMQRDGGSGEVAVLGEDRERVQRVGLQQIPLMHSPPL